MASPVLWGEFLVNTVKDGVQKAVQLQALDNGRFLAVWQDGSSTGADTEASAIYAQRFYSGAVPQGDPIRINSTLEGAHAKPVVTTLSDGRIVYAWEHHVKIGDVDHYSIRARIFNVDGTPYDANGDRIGDDDFEVASSTDAPLTMPRIAALPNKGFVITYTNQAGDTYADPALTADAGVKAVVYGADGKVYGGTQTVNETSAGSQTNSSLVALGGGRFITFFNDIGSNPDDLIEKVHARIFTTNGTTVTADSEFVLRATIEKGTRPVATALADGRFIITWTSESGDGNGRAVMAQVYQSNGTEDGAVFVVNKLTAGDQSTPGVTALAKGGFAISYLDYQDPGVPQVRIAVFDKNKNHIGDDTVVSKSFDMGERAAPSLIELNDGRIIVAWDEAIAGRGDDADGIRGQVLDARFEGINLPGSGENDQYVGTEYDDYLGGAAGNDHLTGRGGNDTLDGGIGNDTLDGGSGSDMMIGGAGDDTYYVDAPTDVIVEGAGGGVDTVKTSSSFILSENLENLYATGTASISLTGNAGANLIVGNAAANTIDGGAGDDTLDGASGADLMRGGAGNDLYYVDDIGDQIVETSSGGTADHVISSVSYILAAYVENLTASGFGALKLTGNASNNTITGNAAANTLNGGLGKDVLVGGAGRDVFVFSTKLGSTNIDKIADFDVKDDTIHLSKAIFSKIAKKGALSKGAFWIGAKAHDKDDRIIYDDKKGILYYDADGNGAGKAVQFATIAKKLKMTAADFFVI
ncbi:calcium-binding protein [Microvirga sp. 2TAF3]|uniref:calcium-binding protein n=1 Tax=Microvirga sp. 2TAF3 TaxID=3233014 RepID=UPI003F9B3315